jgi:apolipoprotein D and lipocalin family protein
MFGRILKKLGVLLLGTSASCSATGNSLKPLDVVPQVDIKRYLGTWHEIARYPNRFQEGCVDSMADYRLRRGGKIRVINSCREGTPDGAYQSATGRAWIVDKSSNAKLKVQFFWPFSGDYWIIALGDNYEYSVVGDPKRKYLWILSRTKKMSARLFEEIGKKLREQSYDPSRLVVNPGSLTEKRDSQEMP